MKKVKVKFNWVDYLEFCIMLDKKPCRYKTLKEFKRIVEILNK